MILGKLLKEASKNLELYDSHQGFKFLAAKREIGRDNIIPNTVDTKAIFMFEYNFRHGTVIGIVGAGGIGYYINLYLKFLQYDKVIAYLIIIFFVVLIIDLISIFARSLFTEGRDMKRPTWLGVLLPAGLLKR